MRKIFRHIILMAMLMLFPLTLTKATTKVVFKEVENGVIKTTIHFDEGFVGGLDLALKLNNIDYKGSSLNENMNRYASNIRYDKDTGMLTIRITAGGVGTKHNLLNENKELEIGNIYVMTDKKTEVKYSFTFDSLTIVGNNWESSEIEDVTLSNNEFTYSVNNKPSSSNKPNDSKEDNEDNTESNNTENKNPDDNQNDSNINTNTNNNNTSNKKPTNSNNNNSNNNSSSEDNNLDDEENNEDLEEDNDLLDKEKEETSKEENNQNRKYNNLLIIVSTLGIALVTGSIVLVINILKRRKIKF